MQKKQLKIKNLKIIKNIIKTKFKILIDTQKLIKLKKLNIKTHKTHKTQKLKKT